MGTWGYKAWESDDAADWFAIMHREIGLRDYVVATLKRGAKKEGTGGVRAAAHVIAKLGEVYQWPVEHMDADLKLAVKALEAAKGTYRSRPSNEREVDRMREEVDNEIDVLEKRLNRLLRNRKRNDRKRRER